MEQLIGIAKKELKLGGLLLLALVVVVFEYTVSSSIASVAFSAFILALGLIIIQTTKLKAQEKSALVIVFFAAFSIVTIATVVRWLGNEASGSLFFNDANDQYKFWIASQEVSRYHSIKEIYKSCVIDNIYLRNGGYYFYIQSLSYIAEKYFDGNHLLLQQLGTSFSAILSSIFIFLILRKYSSPAKIVKCSLMYLALTPIIIDSIGLHRDSIISFFYIVIFYFWLCRSITISSFIIQIILCLILINIRFQHGLFAIVFVLVSLIRTKSRTKWLYFAGLAIIISIYGLSFFDLLVSSVYDTFDYYGDVTSYSLESINSGLGRYVYRLPHPFKEIAQLLWLQLQFPAWHPIANANNFYLYILGAWAFIINIFWFYLFCYTFAAIIKKRKDRVPEELKICLLLFVVFIFLNSSNLDLRRVVCVYPLLFTVYCFINSFRFEVSFSKRFNQLFYAGYGIICMAYILMSAIHG